MKIAKLDGKPEIFFTIQGEGKAIGRPSVFVRLSMCNLQCTWCDTPYTWNWRRFDRQKEIVNMRISEVVEAIQLYPCRNIVITGGEPMLQQSELIEVMDQLPGYQMDVETNGTVVPHAKFDELISTYNVSPKLFNSGNSIRARFRERAFTFFALSPKAVFKFVVDNSNDMNEIMGLVEKFRIQASRVYLMPQGISHWELKDKQEWLVEKCKSCGFNFTTRLHILLYGAKRGV